MNINSGCPRVRVEGCRDAYVKGLSATYIMMVDASDICIPKLNTYKL